MITVSKGNRRVAAMVLNNAVNGVRGIVQCQVPGCQAHIVMLHEDGNSAAFIDDFLMTHDCNPNRFPERRAQKRRAQGAS